MLVFRGVILGMVQIDSSPFLKMSGIVFKTLNKAKISRVREAKDQRMIDFFCWNQRIVEFFGRWYYTPFYHFVLLLSRTNTGRLFRLLSKWLSFQL